MYHPAITDYWFVLSAATLNGVKVNWTENDTGSGGGVWVGFGVTSLENVDGPGQGFQLTAEVPEPSSGCMVFHPLLMTFATRRLKAAVTAT